MTLLHLNNVSMNYAGSTRPALDDIQYKIHPGDFIILLGSNGSGKSTLLKLMHRYVEPNQGKIHFLGKPLHKLTRRDFNQKISILTQNCSESLFPSLTVYENFLLVQKAKTKNSMQFLADYLNDFNPNLVHKLNEVVEQLSGGEKQALALALLFLQPPALLLLDEHTSALDPKTSAQIMQLTAKMIQQHHITCVLTTHDLDIALQYGNRILILREGKISQALDKNKLGSLSKESLLRSYY